MYIFRQQSLSLNDMKNITHNIFTCLPPLSFGELLSDKKKKKVTSEFASF